MVLAWDGSSKADEPVDRAVAFLRVEVPAWPRDNHCFSCHNNGDSARALYRARGVERALLAETTRWLETPRSWDAQGEEGPSNDKKLARLQFALALATAVQTGSSSSRDALHEAADRVERDMAADGSWPSFESSTVASPATYGKRLATALAIRLFETDGAKRHERAIASAQKWLRQQAIENVIEAAAVMLIEDKNQRTDAGRKALALLLRAQSKSGGWGPYPNAPTEAFDTAIVLIALAPFQSDVEAGPALKRGRSALVAMQNPDGSFPGSTRPPGGESYAQRLSTTGWATLALIVFDRAN